MDIMRYVLYILHPRGQLCPIEATTHEPSALAKVRSLLQQEVVERLEGGLEVLPVGCKVGSPHQEQQAGSPGIVGIQRAVDIRHGHNTVIPVGAGPPDEGGCDEGHQEVPRVDPDPEVQQHWAAQEVHLLREACHCYQKMADLKT